MKGVSRIAAAMALLLNQTLFPLLHFIDIMRSDEYIDSTQHYMMSMEPQQKSYALARSR